MIKKGLLFIFLPMMWAGAANVGPTINFDGVPGDKRSPYICNVGLKHEAISDVPICYISGTQNRCPVEWSGSTPAGCECANPVAGNDNDYLKVSTDGGGVSTVRASLDGYNFLYPLTSVKNVHVKGFVANYSSETLGASLLVDFCFPAPGFEASAPGNIYKLFLESQAGSSDYSVGWLAMSRAQVQVRSLNTNCLLQGASAGFFPLTSHLNVVQWTQPSSKDCFIRYEIRERNAIPRDWLASASRIQFYAKIPDRPNCTHGLNYWKTHACKDSPDDPNCLYDGAWDSLPLGPSSMFVNNVGTWLGMMETLPKANPYYILAQQWMSATLNYFAGTTPVSSTTLQNAQLILQANLPTGTFSPAQISQMTSLSGILEAYNGGLSGVPNCE